MHPLQKAGTKRGARALSTEALPSSRQASWLFLCHPEELTAKEQATVPRLRQLHPELDLAYVLAQQFVQMLRTLTGEQLDTWLEAVASSPLTDLKSFASSVYEDKEAILAGLTRAESNGPTEGHITRLKLIKRSMYGRAKFDLLRIRVLFSPQKDLRTQETTRSSPSWRSGVEKTCNSQRTTFGVMGVA
ncbi:transposase [Ktedonobacter robiniae]|uniref:transposase n=1 Tax=Ktedonobacter robiniae TaxID=2778365 RepID=UPI00191522C4|nr:transposase [Ktedonobacter robiniae]